MEVGIFLIKLIKILIFSYFFERIIRIIDRLIKYKQKIVHIQKDEIDMKNFDKEFWR